MTRVQIQAKEGVALKDEQDGTIYEFRRGQGDLD